MIRDDESRANRDSHEFCRPLFITAFSLADFLADNEFFGARRYQDWGVAEFNHRAGKATTAFYQYVTHPARRLLTVTESQGLASAQWILADMLQGRIDPGEGHVARL